MRTLVLILAFAVSDVHSASAAEWSRIDADELVMFTDLPISKGTELARHLVRFRAAIQNFPLVDEAQINPRKPQLELLVFANRRAFSRLMKTRHFAAFTQPGLHRTLLVIGPSTRGSKLFQIARHEIVHYHVRNHPTGYPVWFDEGLAVMLEHLDLDADALDVEKGVARLDSEALFARYTERVKQAHAPSLTHLLATNRIDNWSYERLRRFYGLMGQLVHFLYLGHERGFADRRALLKMHLMERSDTLAGALGTSRAQLTRQFERYRRQPKPELELSIGVGEVTVEHSVMTSVARDRLFARAAEEANPKRAISLYEKVAAQLGDDPASFVDLARAQMIARDQQGAAESLAVAEGLLSEPTANFLLQKASWVTAQCRADTLARCNLPWREASDLIRQALELDPSRIDGLYAQGVIELYRGRPGTAIHYLRAAYPYAPWAPRLNYHLGECLRLLGDPAARVYLDKALAWFNDERWQSVVQMSLDQLVEVED